MATLIACEESGCLTKAMRGCGIDAYSCDILPTRGNSDWHIEGNVVNILNQNWDAIIAFPPCTDLCVSGARWFAEKRADGRQQCAINFFMAIANADCHKICIENPIGIMSTHYRKPSQIIQPWQFGHGETKATCLWLKGLPNLEPTDIVDGRDDRIHKMGPSIDRSQKRSETYQGIADAMAGQWGCIIKS